MALPKPLRLFCLPVLTFFAFAVAKAEEPPASPGVSNFSARSHITPERSAIIGFVVTGKAQNILIRAIGPTLAKWGVAEAAADPRILVFSGDQVIGENDDWGKPTYPEPTDEIEKALWSFTWIHGMTYLKMLFARVGAASLENLTKDAALFINLKPGVYSAVAYSNSGSGEVLLEGYILPDPL